MAPLTPSQRVAVNDPHEVGGTVVRTKEPPTTKKKTYKTEKACADGNWAVAHSAYRINDCAFIFPITPSSPMGEFSDEFASKHKKNLFGQEMKIVEMV